MERATEIFNRIIDKGEAAIDDFIRTRVSEELFLDFKRSSDNGDGNVLNQNDRNNLAKAISGFGNSEGGVIVWGIDCSKDPAMADVAKAKFPIKDAKRFKSWLEGAISGCTVPPHSDVRNEAVLIGGSHDGFVATYIPKSDHAPHQMVGKLQYYIRAGSDFVPTPHQVLAGMFGRRPLACVYPMYICPAPTFEETAICAEVGFVVRNGGPGIATDLFMNLMIFSYGGSSEIALQPSDQARWSGTSSFGNRHISLITNPGVRLPPEAQMQPLVLHLRLIPPFTNVLRVEYLMGASNSPPYRMEFQTPAEKLAKIYSDYKDPNFVVKDSHGFAASVFSIPDSRALDQ
jgi:hypothetical protein